MTKAEFDLTGMLVLQIKPDGVYWHVTGYDGKTQVMLMDRSQIRGSNSQSYLPVTKVKIRFEYDETNQLKPDRA